MLNQNICLSCGQPIKPNELHCSNCGAELIDNHPSVSIAPEMLVYRLGDYLIESGVIKPDDLQRALDFQNTESSKRYIRLGQALVELGLIDRDTLDHAVAKQLISLKHALEESNRQLEQRVKQRTNDLERRLVQIHTAAEITRYALSASGLSDLLHRIVDLIVERLGYYQASVYLVDDSQENANLIEAAGPVGKVLRDEKIQIESASQSLIGWVLLNKRSRIAQEVNQEEYGRKDERLPIIRSEVAIPIGLGNNLLGILDIQHTLQDAFDPDAVVILQTIANNITSAIKNFRLLESTQSSLDDISTLYQASSEMSNATTSDEVIRITASALKKSPYYSVFMINDRGGLQVKSVYDPIDVDKDTIGTIKPSLSLIPMASLEINKFLPIDIPFTLINTDPKQDGTSEIPDFLLDLIHRIGIRTAALVPGRRAGKLDILFILGNRESKPIPTNTLHYFASLAGLTSTALEKVNNLQQMEKRVTALQALNTISQAVSVETDMMVLYEVIHREVVNTMGNINFAIANYNNTTNMIDVPFMHDGQKVQQVDPFPLGEGLTSILIRTQKPLLLVEDVERKTRELGAKYVGAPAKSWLGVPLLVAGDVIGAIIVQDEEHEGRFDEEDQRLLTTLASQVAVAIHNARLLEVTYRHAERERLLYKITTEIRNSPDIASILKITARELSQALGSRRATIDLGADSGEVAHESKIIEDKQILAQSEELSHDEGFPNLMSPGESKEE
jgi:GAF domain-containing protein